MLMTCITHADARDKKKYPFRGLTEQGQREAAEAAERFRELAGILERERGEPVPGIEAVVSSPKARCLETALLFVKKLSDLSETSEILVDPGLKAGEINGDELPELASSFPVGHLVVSGHADLARALAPPARLALDATNDGWFTTRPVLCLIEFEPGSSWEGARVWACEGLVDGRWQNLLSKRTGASL